MGKRDVVKALKFFEACLKHAGLRVSRAVLFGSQARGVATRTSDIDVVIVSSDFHGKDIFERASMTKDAEIMTIRKFMVPMDIITLTPEEWERGESLIVSYAKNGEVIYA